MSLATPALSWLRRISCLLAGAVGCASSGASFVSTRTPGGPAPGGTPTSHGPASSQAAARGLPPSRTLVPPAAGPRAAPPSGDQGAFASSPAPLAAPAGHAPVLSARVVGKQVYTCSLDGRTPPSFEWQLRMPDADLLDDHGRKLGRHYAGLTWELADGSKMRGRRRAVVPRAPDLGEMAFDTRPVEERPGALARVTFVRQVDTKGGGLPAHACDEHAVGKQARIDFTARQVFFAPAGP